MKKILSAALALLLLALPCMALGQDAGIPTRVTIVPAPMQTQAERPACFPDPSADYIPLPAAENLAQGKSILSGAHTDVYVNTNVNDGKTDTYWESKGFPAEMIIELGETHTIATVAVCLNPSSTWEARIQEIAVWVSQDGETFTQAAAAEKYQFDPATGNRIRIDFTPVEAACVKVIFTMNSSSRTGGAQAAEICVYGEEAAQ